MMSKRSGCERNSCDGKHRGKVDRSGYVLLVVIAVSIVTVTVLSKLATASLQKGLEAADAERMLQKRWGAITIEEAVLNRAEKRFALQEEEAVRIGRMPPPATLRDAITMGGVTYDILLGDEDAKLNLNTVYHNGGATKTQDAIESVLGVGGRPVLRLLPAVKPQSLSRESLQLTASEDSEDSIPTVPKAFRSWGEVMDLAKLQRQAGPRALPMLAKDMTCWGNGQLNLRRATDPAILAIVGSVMQGAGAKRILKRYRQNPTLTKNVLILSEVTSRNDQERLAGLISETSNNFSVWINASTATGRDYRTFSVTERGAEGEVIHSRFAF